MGDYSSAGFQLGRGHNLDHDETAMNPEAAHIIRTALVKIKWYIRCINKELDRIRRALTFPLDGD